jgi:outer membrane protein TolC
MPRWMIALGILGCAGCAGAPHVSKPKVTATIVPSSTIADASVDDTVLPVTHTEIAGDDVVTMNLPSALAAVGGQHPAVGLARWRVQEAYAQLERAQVLWLPSIQSGYSFHRHDGNYQASNGDIVDVNRSSFQYGLGSGAVGAGTTMRPGIVAQFHLADAIFQPKVAEKSAWAHGHAASAVLNEQMLSAALAYLELLSAHQTIRIVEDTRDKTSTLTKITKDFSEAGEGLQADADRMQTELTLIESRVVAAHERISVASARLAQALSIQAASPIVPLDPTVVPIELVSFETDLSTLIGTGLASRPELKESQALVAAACEAHQREKYAPFVPSVLLGFSTGGFGGGIGSNLNNVDSRYDVDAAMTWEVRNLGLGERAARRGASSQVQQAKFEKIRVMDQVAREISESHSQVKFRREQIEITQRAIQSAQDSYERNLSRIQDGEGLPIEVLQSIAALESSRQAYTNAIVEHNQAQFRLQWALGFPVNLTDSIR